jgi:hypothetical protein
MKKLISKKFIVACGMSLVGVSSFAANDSCAAAAAAAVSQDDLPVIVEGFCKYEITLNQYRRSLQINVKQGILAAEEAKFHIDEYAKALEEGRAERKKREDEAAAKKGKPEKNGIK